MIFRNTKPAPAFSLVELLIALIVISCLIAAFVPVITKKVKSSEVTVYDSNSGEITTECNNSENYGPDCKLCTKKYCIDCSLSYCESEKYIDSKTCSCQKCSDKFSNCTECTNLKCTKCQNTGSQSFYLESSINKCIPCPTGAYCDGINKYDNCPDGFYCNSSGMHPCSEKYGYFCTKCDKDYCKLCANYYLLAKNRQSCESCSIGNCLECKFNGTTKECTKCAQDRILQSNNCNLGCSDKMQYCLYCRNASTCIGCTGDAFLNSLNTCTKCNDGIKMSNCLVCKDGRNADSPYCLTCNGGYYMKNGACISCLGYDSNCAICDAQKCIGCKKGFHIDKSTSKCVSDDNEFNCSDSNFMQIGNLCVTRKNMGDSLVLTIPQSVIVAQAKIDSCYSYTQNCCWKGEVSPACDAANGNYSGCNRTVCNWYAANEICSNFNYGGKKWRLPTNEDFKNWGAYSLYLKDDGLMLCDAMPEVGSSYCVMDFNCPSFGVCRPHHIWGSSVNTFNAYYARVYRSKYESGVYIAKYFVYSVRCVTDI